MFLKLCFSLFFFLVATTFFSPVVAQSINFTASIGDTAVSFDGCASPNAVITFMENGTVIGTTTADAGGFFAKTFSAQEPGVHTFTIYVTDVSNRNSISISQTFVLIEFQTLEIHDLHLPPTININSSSFSNSDQIIVYGYSRPDSAVEVRISGESGRLALIKTDSQGFYQISFNANSFESGSYKVNTRVQIDSNTSSSFSEELSFVVANGSFQLPQTTELPSEQTSCRFFYFNLCFFDRDNTGYLEEDSELIDLLIGFIQNFDQHQSTVFDINNSGKIDIEDLSIALFYTRSDLNNRDNVLGLVSSEGAELGINLPFGIFADTAASAQTSNWVVRLVYSQIALGSVFLVAFIVLAVITRRYENK